MATDATDLTIEILRRVQGEQAGLRQDLRQLQQSFVDIARLIQRMDQRSSDMKSDLETMFKMELIGQHAHQQTRLEQMFDDKLSAFEERISQLIDAVRR